MFGVVAVSAGGDVARRDAVVMVGDASVVRSSSEGLGSSKSEPSSRSPNPAMDSAALRWLHRLLSLCGDDGEEEQGW